MRNLKIILNSIIVIAVIAIIIIGSTWAYFIDRESSSGNVISSGTLDLKISDLDENGSDLDGVSNTWSMSNMLQGVSFVNGSIWFRNAGTIDTDHLEITVSNITIDPPGPGSDTEEGTTDLDKVMEITEMKYYNPDLTVTDCLALLNDSNGNGFIDLDDLESQGIDNLNPPIRSEIASSRLDMTIKIHASADSNYKGDSLQSIFSFTLNQDPSQ